LDRNQYYANPGDFVSILWEQRIMSPYFFHIVSLGGQRSARCPFKNKLLLIEGFYRGNSLLASSAVPFVRQSSTASQVREDFDVLSEIGQSKIYFGQV
jgi:hypothetical protein